jgi:UDP-3-O-[3-hydroxymyristoyl] glucosamine N-acyltransferase
MRLSEISIDQSLRVVRDGAFSSLGFSAHRRPGMLAYLAAEEFLPDVLGNDAISCVLAAPELAEQVPDRAGLAVVDDPRVAFYRLHDHLARETAFYGVPPTGRIAPTARVHPTAVIAANVVLEDEVEIGPHAVIHSGVHVGSQSVIRAGSVIGSEGFQVLLTGTDVIRVKHAGGVRIGKRVDIHANCCVDRGLFGETTVGDDTSIDNLVYIAHEVSVGRRCRIGAHAILNGSTVVGDNAWIGPGAVLSSGISVGTNAHVTLGAVVTRAVPDGARVTGNFAIDHEKFLSFLRSIR